MDKNVIRDQQKCVRISLNVQIISISSESSPDAKTDQNLPKVSRKLKTSKFLALKMSHRLQFGPDGAQNSRQLHSHSVLSES